MTVHDPAHTAARDQDTAELRDLVALVHKHRQSGVCDPDCPGLDAIVALPGDPRRWLHLLVAALIRVDDLQTGIAGAIHSGNPLDHPWHP